MKAYPIGLIMGALLAGALAVSGQGTSGQSVVSLGEVVVVGMTEPAGVGTATEVQGDQAELRNRRDLAGALALASLPSGRTSHTVGTYSMAKSREIFDFSPSTAWVQP